MGEKITPAVLSQQIKNLHDDFREFKQEQFKPVALACKENTEFRYRAKGVIGLASFISAAVGGFFMWMMKYFWPK